MRRWLRGSAGFLTALTLLAVLPSAQSATAAFPGRSGKLAVERRSGQNANIFFAPADGGSARRFHVSRASILPHWSADGKRLLFASRTKLHHVVSGLYAANADGSALKKLGAWDRMRQTGASGLDFTWSPSGKRIYWTGRGPHGTMRIESSTQDGKHLRVNSPAGESTCCPAVSPNGKWIAFLASNPKPGYPCFTSTGDPWLGLYVIGVNGGRVRHVASNVTAYSSPDWSPDGRRLLYNGVRQDPDDPSTCRDGLYTTGAGGAGQRLVYEGLTEPTYAPIADSPRAAVYSPDGRKIAFEGDYWHGADGYLVEIFIINADGTGIHALRDPWTQTPRSEDWSPSWQPLRR